MPALVWDKVGDRVYESGLDKGVLYLPDGSGVPWNGLTSVIEQFDKTTSPVYFDGMKIQDLVVLGNFSATMKAITYPEEFVELEGLGKYRQGMFFGDQPPGVFGLCYRTRIGSDLVGDESAYKIHILYNLTAIPTDKSYATVSNDPSLVEFEWNLTAIPEETPGFRPSAHIILDSRNFDAWLLEDLENMLYGNESALSVLIPMPDLISYINDWYRVKIIDNGDGTWTATSMRDGFIQLLNDEGLFQIIEINAVYLDEETFEISDTIDAADVPLLEIVDNGDGTWTASTSNEGLIVMTGPDSFELRNVNAILLGPDFYRISNVLS